MYDDWSCVILKTVRIRQMVSVKYRCVWGNSDFRNIDLPETSALAVHNKGYEFDISKSWMIWIINYIHI